jgi:serine/threonine protein phosphatase 1
MASRVIAIGDVHGCASALALLVEMIRPVASDTVVVLGDCVDRGPDSKGVIDLMLKLSDICQVVPLFGNHEEMVLAAYDRPATATEWLRHGGREMLASYGVESAREVPREHLLFMRTWRDFWETPTHFFAHASYDPYTPLDKQEWGFQRWQAIHRAIPQPHQNGKIAVVGHSAQKSGLLLDAGHLLCLDTYCHGGGWLTGYDVTSRSYWQTNELGQTQQG